MKRLFISLINLYQITISPDHGVLRTRYPTCVFYPTCSEYAKQSIGKYGFLKGSVFSVRRILRCHPGQKSFVDLP